MLHEFALNPIVISTFDKFRYYFENFGVEHGRLISQFPKRWQRMVIEACTEHGTKRTEFVERLRGINSKLIQSGRPYDGELDWLENAETQHITKPFHAIISISNPRKQLFVLIDDELDETDPRWNVDRERVIPRTAEDIASCCARLLQISTEIIFVDRNFNPSAIRWRRPLERLLDDACHGKNPVRLELHIGWEDAEGISREMALQNWCSNCEEKLHSLIPRGFSLRVFIWERKERQVPGDKLHPRYILTDRGGIRIDYGLDEGKPGETTDISLLNHSLYEHRWKDYQKDTTTFKFVGEMLINGTKGD